MSFKHYLIGFSISFLFQLFKSITIETPSNNAFLIHFILYHQIFLQFIIMNFGQTRFSNYESLAQVLKIAKQTQNLNYYTYALGLSRNAQPDPQTVRLTLQLIETAGPKWLEVLSRQAINNYRVVYDVAFQNKHALQILVGLATFQSHREELHYLCNRILSEMQESGQLWSAFYMLLKISIDQQDQKYKFELLGNINKLVNSNKLPPLLQNLATLQFNQQMQHQLSDKNVTFFNLYTIIIQFYAKCSHYALRKGIYIALFNSHQSLVNFLNQIFNNTLSFLQTQSSTFINQNKPNTNILISDGLLCLQQLSKLHFLQLRFIQNAPALVKALMSLPILIQGNSVEDRLNLQYGISTHQFGADIQSLVCQTIYKLSQNVLGVFKEVLLSIQTKIISQTDINSVISALILLALMKKLIIPRDDLVLEIASPLLDYIMKRVNEHTPMQISCRVLRLLMFYGEILNQKQYKNLIQCSIGLLASQPSNSFGFKQADNIFEYMIQNQKDYNSFRSHFQNSLKQTILQLLNIVSQTKNLVQGREEKAMRVAKLINMLINTNQTIVSTIAPKIVKQSINWLLQQINFVWAKHIKHTPFIHELVKLLKHSVNLIGNQTFINDTSDQLYNLFQLLKQPQKLEIVDQLVQILEIKLKSDEMDSRLCRTLVTSLQSLVTYSNGNLDLVSNLLKVLNDQRVSKSVIFQWGDLITYLANLYFNYLSNYTQFYNQFYRTQYTNICSIFEKYLQIYEPYFEDNSKFRNHLLQRIRALPQSQWRIRFFLVLNHQAPTDGYDIFNLQQILSYRKTGTMKLTFIYFVDILFRNYNQRTLNNLVAFNKIYQQKKMRKDLQSQDIQIIPYPRINIVKHLHQGFKELKNKNLLDVIQYNSIIKQFRLE